MSISWRMLVTGADGVAKPTIDLDDQVAGIESMDLDAAGSCLEASFTAIPSAVDLEPRDVITVQYSLNDFVSVKSNLYKGYITSAGTSRSNRLAPYRAMGLKQRAYEVVLEDRVITGGDVAAMAKWVMAIALDPGLVVGTDIPLGAFPTTGFELGDRYPRLETAGDFIDALAATVGSFIVPTGGSYTYDGTTFTPGDLVPAVRWGAGATGLLFFHRPLGSLALDEADTFTEWTPRNAEGSTDRVTLVYASEYSGEPRVSNNSATAVEEPHAQPLAVTVGSGDLNAGRVVTLEAPLDFMTDGITSTSSTGSVTNVANAFDGNPATYAEFGVGGGTITAFAGSVIGAIAIIDVEFSENGIVSLLVNPASSNVILELEAGTTGIYAQRTQLRYREAPKDPPERQRLAFPIMPEVRASGTVSAARARIIAAEDVKLYGLELWVIDDDVATRLGAGLARSFAEIAAELRVDGAIDALTTANTAGGLVTLDLTDISDTAVELAIERFERRLTVDGGLETIVHAGQSFSSEAEAQRVILERLARRAVAQGGALR